MSTVQRSTTAATAQAAASKPSQGAATAPVEPSGGLGNSATAAQGSAQPKEAAVTERQPASTAAPPPAAGPAQSGIADTRPRQESSGVADTKTGATVGAHAYPDAILTATGLLLAFLIGLYTLIGRDRKSPFLTNSLFGILPWCVGAAFFALMAKSAGEYEQRFAWVAAVSLLIALGMTFWRVYKLYMRFALFVDSPNPKQLGIYRHLKHAARRFSERKVYEWNAIPLSADLQARIEAILLPVDIQSSAEKAQGGGSTGRPPTSAAISVGRHGKANDILVQLAREFLERKLPVQYMTASRHPLEFVTLLRDAMKRSDRTSWEEISSKLVVVDAYTKHFGYADSVYLNATTTLTRDLNVKHVKSGESFAGLHTASSRAFNLLKEDAAQKTSRDPVLVIYEDCYALADLESKEQYRVFIRHVVPSERMWQGMFTVFIETAQDDADWRLLSAYCDISVKEEAEQGAKK